MQKNLNKYLLKIPPPPPCATLSEFFLIGLDHSPSCLTLPFIRADRQTGRQTDGQTDGRTALQDNASGRRRTGTYKLFPHGDKVLPLNLFLEHFKDSATRLLVLVNVDTSATLDNIKYPVLFFDIICHSTPNKITSYSIPKHDSLRQNIFVW